MGGISLNKEFPPSPIINKSTGASVSRAENVNTPIHFIYRF